MEIDIQKKNSFSLFFLLKFMGLEPIFNFDSFPNFKNKKYYMCKIFTNWSYTFFIMLLLMFQPIFETILLFEYKILTNLPNTLFLYIIPIQYYISILYFRSQRKKRIYESGNMKFLHDSTGIGKCLPEENTLIKSVLIISIFIIIESIITLFLIPDAEIYVKLSSVIYWKKN